MYSQQCNRVTRGRGFSLIELLVVIAIIAILAAILFPVFALVQEDVRKTTCLSQLHDVYVATKQYKIDNNKFPEGAIYDYAELAAGGYYNGSGAIAPMNTVTQRPLFKISSGKYMKDPSKFICPDNAPVNLSAVTTAVYPPGLTLSGIVPNYFTPANPAYFYKADSYDVGPQVDVNGKIVSSGGAPVIELHYSLSWTNVTGPGDSPNQLKYPDPPQDKTVITWCTYHAAVQRSGMINVLLLSGTCKPAPVNQFVQKGPLGTFF